MRGYEETFEKSYLGSPAWRKEQKLKARYMIDRRFHAPRRASLNQGLPPQVREIHERRKLGVKFRRHKASSRGQLDAVPMGKWVHGSDGSRFYAKHFLMCLQVEALAQKIKH